MLEQIKTYLTTNIIYALSFVIALLAIASGTQTVRVYLIKADLSVAESKLLEEKAINATNIGTLKQIKEESDSLKARLDKATNDIIYSEKRHNEYIRKLLSETPIPVSGNCNDMVEWARKMAVGGSK